MWFFFFPELFPKGSVSFPVVSFRGSVLITSPSRCLCFIVLKASFPNLPSSTSSTLESYLDWPGRAAKGFVKLPPVISPARRINAEPTHTHACTRTPTHTLMWAHTAAACCSAFIRCIHLYFSSSWGWVSPRQRRQRVIHPVAMTHQVQPLPQSQLWWVLFSSLLFTERLFCQLVLITACWNLFQLNTAEKPRWSFSELRNIRGHLPWTGTLSWPAAERTVQQL